MAWIALLLAGVLEVVWAYAMKQSQGFTRVLPAVITVIAILASLGLLTWSMRTIPLGVAYTIWTGIGAVGAFALGVFVLGEEANALRLLAAALILSGLVLMKASDPS